MRLNFDREVQHRMNRFSRLGTWYILALSAIATVGIIGQFLIQSHLLRQESDSRVVNVAGKQRMLSQKIAKICLLIEADQPIHERRLILQQLQDAVTLWKISQEGLMYGNDSLGLPGSNSDEIFILFRKVEGDFKSILSNTDRLIQKLSIDPVISKDSVNTEVRSIQEHEDEFLAGMERIVFQYDQEAKNKVAGLSRMEYIVLIVSILVIVLEILFIFRPTAVHVNKTMNTLIASEKNAKKLTKEIGALYASLEKTYEQMSIVNQPAENPRLLAKADKGGNVTFITEHFSTVTGALSVHESMRLADLLPGIENPDDWMDDVVDATADGNTWQGNVCIAGAEGGERWFEISIIPVYTDQGDIGELVMMGSDITVRKEAERNMNQKNRAEIEKKINQQKFRSVLILEGQEEERKRIAMDIHDGIGQMLTSLKYQIESIELDGDEKARQKIGEIDQLIKELIREVRKVTFNLKPTVLGDYGLQAGLNVFIQEIGKLTQIRLTYATKGEIDRLPQKIENNIFRIIQEAINNAIKYSGAETIAVELEQVAREIVIRVKDDGKGFDTKLAEARSMNIESGRGFFNMYERTAYINGVLDVQSSPGKGTTVTLMVPVRSSVTAT